MLASLSLIFLMGLAMAAIVQRLQLPRIIGMLVTGILLEHTDGSKKSHD